MDNTLMEIRHVEFQDKVGWYLLDRHLSEAGFEEKVKNKQGYVLLNEGRIVGVLRYNLFWDNTPFCTLLFIDEKHREQGLGRLLMDRWESDMKSQDYGMLMTSTQVDEESQHFYRKLGYKDCGGFVVDVPGYEQPMEMIMIKAV
ncbi:MAG: GNAT family N-acetyltransferase [Lachnospiraceae bacterium]|nr:GNAT family N-acetyltransferase [Lachnospiraceae bacterium]